jgi:hypothetical protein
MTYDDWKTDPDFDQEMSDRSMKRLLGNTKDPDDERQEREDLP